MKRVAYAVGTALVAVGVYALVAETSWPSLRAAIIWFGGGVVLHDGLLVPLTLLTGAALARFLPGAYRGLVQGALVVSAMITLALLPLLSGLGLSAADPSQQPLPYRRNLLLVLAAVWVVTGVLALWRAAQRRGAVTTPAS